MPTRFSRWTIGLWIFAANFAVNSLNKIDDYNSPIRSAGSVLYDMFGMPKYDWPKAEADSVRLEPESSTVTSSETEKTLVENKFKPSGRLKYTFIASLPPETTTVDNNNVATPWHFIIPDDNRNQPTTRKTSIVKSKSNKVTGSVSVFSAPFPPSDNDENEGQLERFPFDNDLVTATRSINAEITKLQPTTTTPQPKPTTARVTNRLIDLEWRLLHFGFDDEEPTTPTPSSRSTTPNRVSFVNSNFAVPPDGFRAQIDNTLRNNGNEFDLAQKPVPSVFNNNVQQTLLPQTFPGQRQPEDYASPSVRPPPSYNGATAFGLTSPPSYASGRTFPQGIETYQGPKTSASWEFLRNQYQRWNESPGQGQTGDNSASGGAGSSYANNGAGGYFAGNLRNQHNNAMSCFCPCSGGITGPGSGYNTPGVVNPNSFQPQQPFHSSDTSGYFFFGPPLKGR